MRFFTSCQLSFFTFLALIFLSSHSTSAFAGAAWPVCGSGERTTEFKIVNQMTRSVLSLDIRHSSLVEVKPQDPRRAQYWLLNRGGATYLRLDGHVQIEGQAEACQVDGQTLELYGCGPIFGFTQCIRAQVRRVGEGTFFLSFAGHADWNRQYVEHPLAPMERN
jgi:prepilin-type processing-associated H-X9-DG protein